MKYAKINRVPLHLQFNLDISFISLDIILLFLKYIAAVPFTEHHVGLPYTRKLIRGRCYYSWVHLCFRANILPIR